MGEVYLADDTRLHRKVALKSLHDPSLQSAEARARLLREARAAAALDHPAIAAIYDVIEAEGRTHIVMEYVRGETLSARLGRGPLPLAQVVHVGVQLADALAAAHGQGVVHRDLKPANVSLLPDGRVKVLDFGIARVRPDATTEGTTATPALGPMTTGGRLVGTPGYTAPEQLLGHSADQRSDIYSLGVMLFELSTGRRPFKDPTAMGQALATLTEPPPAPTDVDPSLPAAFSQIVVRAMAREPTGRHQSARELRDELKRLASMLADQPTADLGAAVAPPGRLLPGLRPRAVGWIAALVLIAGLLVAWPSLRRTPQAPTPAGTAVPAVVAVPSFANLSGDPTKDYIGVGMADALVASLARLQGVSVLSRSALAGTAGGKPDLRQLAREQGAGYVVDAGFQRSGTTLRINVSLVRPDGSVVWGQSYEDDENDLFALQARLAEGVSAGLQLTLLPADLQRLSRPPTANVEAYADYSQGRAFLDRLDAPGNVDRAIGLFQRAIQQDPGFALAHAALGEAYWTKYLETKDLSMPAHASEAILEALRLDPEQPHVRVSLALIYQGTGRLDAAVEELRRALAAQPANDEAHRLLGEILASQGRLDDGVDELKKAIAVRPGFWRLHSRLGIVFLRAGRYPEAVAALQRVGELQPDNAVGFHLLGTAYQTMGDNSRALEQYERVMKLSPMAETYVNVGVIHFEEGRFAAAAEAFERAVELKPNEPQNHRSLGDAYQHLGRVRDAQAAYSEAVRLAEEMLKINPKDGRMMGMLAVCEAKLGRFTLARRHADEGVALSPTNSDALYRKAIVHALAGETARALAALEQALAHGYSPTLAAKDEDLVAIRQAPEFKRVIEQHR